MIGSSAHTLAEIRADPHHYVDSLGGDSPPQFTIQVKSWCSQCRALLERYDEFLPFSTGATLFTSLRFNWESQLLKDRLGSTPEISIELRIRSGE